MTDYPELYRQLAREIIKHEGEIVSNTTDFIVKFLAQLRKDGYVLTQEAEAIMRDYITQSQAAIKTGIEIATATALAQGMQSQTLAQLVEQSFKQQWPDGLILSDRLWKWDAATRQGVTDVLQQGIRAGRAVDSITLDMQKAIETAAGGQRFKIVSEHIDDWVTELHESALTLIHDPAARQQWLDAIEQAREIIDGLKATGSRTAAEQVLKEMQKAVEKGKEELLDKAVKWWTYDKQLYNLKRIARTEMATSMHRAVIAGSEADETVIGYQWRLSSSHPVTDICDYYANVEMGLGKGVFTKDAVPRSKAHPHCMCLLIPRVSPIKQTGSKNYADWLRGLSTDKQKTVMPDWARQAMENGTPVENLIRPDGLGLVTQDQYKAAIKNKPL